MITAVGAACAGPDGDPLPEPVRTSVRITEVMPLNRGAVVGPLGNSDDWVEIHNAGAEPVDFSGYFLSDELGDLRRDEVGSGVTIPPGGYVVLWADGAGDRGPDHLGFRLSAQSEVLALTDPGGTLIDLLRWENAWVDHSYVPLEDSVGSAARCAWPTPAGPNDARCSSESDGP